MQECSCLRLICLAAMSCLLTGLTAAPTSAGVVPTNETKAVFPDDKSNAFMGFSIVAQGDTVVAGAPIGVFANPQTDNGEAEVWLRNGNTWNRAAKLIPDVGALNHGSGTVVAMDGDVVVMGQLSVDEGGHSSTGIAHVFVKPAGGWNGQPVPLARLRASDADSLWYFGISAAISGDIIVVGASGVDGAAANTGAVYVFVKPPGGWAGDLTQSAKLIASDGALNDALGSSVAIDGDVIAATVPGKDLRFPDQGAVYVFLKPAGGWAGVISQSAKLAVSGAAQGDDLSVVALSGNTIVAGADAVTQDGVTEAGAVYVFERPAGQWSGNLTQVATILSDAPIQQGLFGTSLAVQGDVIAIGHYLTTGNRAFVVQRPTGGWPALTKLHAFVASDSQDGDIFGGGVALTGDSLIVGAPGLSTDFNTAVGAFYAYTLKPDSDNDGIADEADGCPDDPDKSSPGVCGCGSPEGDPCVAAPPADQACCGGGMPMMMPFMWIGWKWRRRRRWTRER